MPFVACLSPTGPGCCGPLRRDCRGQAVEAAIRSSGLCRAAAPMSLWGPWRRCHNASVGCPHVSSLPGLGPRIRSREPWDEAWGHHGGHLPCQGLCHLLGCPQGCARGSHARLIARAERAGHQGRLLTLLPEHGATESGRHWVGTRCVEAAGQVRGAPSDGSVSRYALQRQALACAGQ